MRELKSPSNLFDSNQILFLLIVLKQITYHESLWMTCNIFYLVFIGKVELDSK